MYHSLSKTKQNNIFLKNMNGKINAPERAIFMKSRAIYKFLINGTLIHSEYVYSYVFSDLVEKFMIRKLWRNLFMTDQGTDECMKILFPLIDKDGDGEVNKLEFT